MSFAGRPFAATPFASENVSAANPNAVIAATTPAPTAVATASNTAAINIAATTSAPTAVATATTGAVMVTLSTGTQASPYPSPVRTVIPSVPLQKTPGMFQYLQAVKAAIEKVNGTTGTNTLSPLSSTATNTDMLTALNAIIARLS